VSHSFTNLLCHLVFSTKDRQPWLDEGRRPELFACLGALTREEGGITLAVGGVADHVHLLVKLRQDRAVSDVLRVLKAKCSRWVHKSFADRQDFAWQTGYGAFSVSHSQVERVRLYTLTQEDHHRTRPFQQEFLALLKAHDIPYTEEDLWD
jgi:REP element-mobilizing transposase RayT